MSNKHLVFLVLMLLALPCHRVSAANPDDGDNLYLYINSSASPIVYSLDEISAIRFPQYTYDQFFVETVSSLIGYDYADFRLITFSERIAPTGIDDLHAGKQADISINFDAQTKTIGVESGAEMSGLAVYDAQGRIVYGNKAKAKAYNVSLSNTGKGIYVVKVYGKAGTVTKKIVK